MKSMGVEDKALTGQVVRDQCKPLIRRLSPPGGRRSTLCSLTIMLNIEDKQDRLYRS